VANATNGSSPTSAHATPAASVTSEVADASGGWLEVGPRQRAAETRSSGHALTSPINSIFSGLLRSELRVPGRKDSVTLEPYQSLQLHIDSPEVRNIVDALRNLTNPEVLHADFKSPQGKDVNATKQVFIEDLPPVLILHLKRFQFDWQVNGTVKIWKKIGYPLELEIPREIFSRRKRNTFLSEPLPKYRLNAVVYHHGKQASGGHYTVDVLREDGREWIRLDDTVIRRMRREEVAQAGAEETDSSSATASSNTTSTPKPASTPTPAGNANRFAGMGEEEAGESDNDWSAPVNGNGKKWSSVANGATSPKNKLPKESIKDNKVAYLLFYQRIN
jgi:ubiquitin carboxyl-terminal hydrolase 10